MTMYHNYSGGAEGADMKWDTVGREYGFDNHTHFKPLHLKQLTDEVRKKLEDDIFYAAIALGRPTEEFPGKDLVRRNWLQAHNADAVYAIAYIINPGEKDKGFTNHTGKQNVSGGTGWACQIAILMSKPVHVFDMKTNCWYTWGGIQFVPRLSAPTLTKRYAGIGSRQLTKQAIQAIHDVYQATKNKDE